MTETNVERLERLKELGVEPMTTVWDMSEDDLTWLVFQAERAQFYKQLHGKRSVQLERKNIEFFRLKDENVKITDLLVRMRETFTEYDQLAEGHGMEDAIACPVAVAQYAANKLERTIEENKRLEKALYVAFSHAVESQADGTIDVITDTLQGLDFIERWDADCEKGEKLFKEWIK